MRQSLRTGGRDWSSIDGGQRDGRVIDHSTTDHGRSLRIERRFGGGKRGDLPCQLPLARQPLR